MAKSNLTIQLDQSVIRRAKVVAAKRGTSVSGLVAQELTDLVERDERYELARAEAEALLQSAIPRGGRSWRRDEIYDR